jgi:hypothetical protein
VHAICGAHSALQDNVGMLGESGDHRPITGRALLAYLALRIAATAAYVSMAVTAFPGLARILTDSGLQKTGLGRIALACGCE